jgi:hypothetical protein
MVCLAPFLIFITQSETIVVLPAHLLVALSFSTYASIQSNPRPTLHHPSLLTQPIYPSILPAKRTDHEIQAPTNHRLLHRSDNDVFGHMNNPYYDVLIDSIANQYLINRCSYTTSKPPQAAIIVNTYCDYFGSVLYPGEVEVGLRVAILGIFKKG